jgi:hypothetical protein
MQNLSELNTRNHSLLPIARQFMYQPPARVRRPQPVHIQRSALSKRIRLLGLFPLTIKKEGLTNSIAAAIRFKRKALAHRTIKTQQEVVKGACLLKERSPKSWLTLISSRTDRNRFARQFDQSHIPLRSSTILPLLFLTPFDLSNRAPPSIRKVPLLEHSWISSRPRRPGLSIEPPPAV